MHKKRIRNKLAKRYKKEAIGGIRAFAIARMNVESVMRPAIFSIDSFNHAMAELGKVSRLLGRTTNIDNK